MRTFVGVLFFDKISVNLIPRKKKQHLMKTHFPAKPKWLSSERGQVVSTNKTLQTSILRIRNHFDGIVFKSFHHSLMWLLLITMMMMTVVRQHEAHFKWIAVLKGIVIEVCASATINFQNFSRCNDSKIWYTLCYCLGFVKSSSCMRAVEVVLVLSVLPKQSYQMHPS